MAQLRERAHRALEASRRGRIAQRAPGSSSMRRADGASNSRRPTRRPCHRWPGAARADSAGRVWAALPLAGEAQRSTVDHQLGEGLRAFEGRGGQSRRPGAFRSRRRRNLHPGRRPRPAGVS
jgi:hypothetical protein